MAGHIPDSLSVDWCTPQREVDGVHETFGGPPDLDPCSNPHSTVGAWTSFMLPEKDGLVDSWSPYLKRYVNPPFGKGWWFPAAHTDLRCAMRAIGEVKNPCVCGAEGKREYVWPAERAQKKATMSDAQFKAWIKPQKLVSIADWIQLCSRTNVYKDTTTIGLIPAYPGVKVWHTDVWPTARAIFFPEGRLHFRLVDSVTGDVVNDGPAPMDCCMPYWGEGGMRLVRFQKYFSKFGHVQVLR